jgi:hypothetical protein
VNDGHALKVSIGGHTTKHFMFVALECQPLTGSRMNRSIFGVVVDGKVVGVGKHMTDLLVDCPLFGQVDI